MKLRPVNKGGPEILERAMNDISWRLWYIGHNLQRTTDGNFKQGQLDEVARFWNNDIRTCTHALLDLVIPGGLQVTYTPADTIPLVMFSGGRESYDLCAEKDIPIRMAGFHSPDISVGDERLAMPVTSQRMPGVKTERVLAVPFVTPVCIGRITLLDWAIDVAKRPGNHMNGIEIIEVKNIVDNA